MAVKVAFSGALTRDPVLQVHNDHEVAYFTVAVRTGMKTPDGQPETNFYNCKLWDKNCRFIAENGKKSAYVTVFGSLAMRDFVTPNGVTRPELVVVADAADLQEHPPKKEEEKPVEEPVETAPEE